MVALKGIILAGGSGTRLYPSTIALSKQLLTIYDKPMIYYPLSTLMLAGIQDILIISTPRDVPMYQELLGDGKQYGIRFTFAVQDKPRGLAEAFLIGENHIGQDRVCLILGDNVFYSHGFSGLLRQAAAYKDGAVIFGYQVSNPWEYGVVEFTTDGRVLSLEEKPKQPKSKYAIPGLYFYDQHVPGIAKQLKPSPRGELEIIDIHKAYLRQNKLRVELFGRGMAWLDTGTHKSMLEAANFVETVQTRQGLYIACLEEIAWKMGFITRSQAVALGEKFKSSEYGKYILKICGNEV